MAFHDLPFPDQLRQLIEYDPLTGAMTWRPRTPAMFEAVWIANRYIRTAEAQCSRWNSLHAGTRAFVQTIQGGRLQGRVFNRAYAAHRVAWAIFHGHEPKGQIDHINGDPSDNRIANLREVDASGNQRNRRLDGRNNSGVLGVSQDKRSGTWNARIGDGKGYYLHLGTFPTKAAAVAARKNAERALGYHPNHGRRAVSAVPPPLD